MARPGKTINIWDGQPNQGFQTGTQCYLYTNGNKTELYAPNDSGDAYVLLASTGWNGTVQNVKVNNVSIVSNNVANLNTQGTYNASSNKIATMSDIPVTDIQVNSTSIVSNNVANLITNTAYNASSNKIATMSDIPSIPVTDIRVNSTSILSSGVADLKTNTAYNATTNKIATMSDIPTGIWQVNINGSLSTAISTSFQMETRKYQLGLVNADKNITVTINSNMQNGEMSYLLLKHTNTTTPHTVRFTAGSGLTIYGSSAIYSLSNLCLMEFCLLKLSSTEILITYNEPIFI